MQDLLSMYSSYDLCKTRAIVNRHKHSHRQLLTGYILHQLLTRSLAVTETVRLLRESVLAKCNWETISDGTIYRIVSNIAILRSYRDISLSR